MVVPWRFLRVLVLVVMILGVPLVGSGDSSPMVISGGWLVVVQMGPNEPKTSVNNRNGNYTSSEAAFRFPLNTKPPRASERYTVKDSTIFTV